MWLLELSDEIPNYLSEYFLWLIKIKNYYSFFQLDSDIFCQQLPIKISYTNNFSQSLQVKLYVYTFDY